MKKALIVVLALAVLAVALTGASKWPAKVWIYNGDDASTAYFNFGGDEYPIVQLTVAPGEAKNFDFPRGVWDGKLTYCGTTKSFTINANHNVWLNLPSCAKARQTGRDLFQGEPSMEKYNKYLSSPQEWKFQY
jgi:hypothetical protein